jgi:hypothetical protein
MLKVLVLGVVTIVVGLAVACGGGDESDSSDDDAVSEEAVLAYAQCMRAEGIDFPDPEPGQFASLYHQTGDAAFQAAATECEPKLSGLVGHNSSNAGHAAEVQDRALEVAKCVREQGFEFPDPKLTDDGRVVTSAEEFDTEDSELRRVADECTREVFGQMDSQ